MSKYRMLSDNELDKFKAYIAKAPNKFIRQFALDEGEEIEEAAPRKSGSAMRLLRILSKLSPEDWADLQKILAGRTEAEDGDFPANGLEREIDEAVPAMDAKAFAAKFPDGAKIERVFSVGRHDPQPRPSKVGAAPVGSSFFDNHPDARRIGRA